jgi:hypothetical protein
MKLLARATAAVLALVAAFTLGGCIPSKFATPQEEATAQHWLAELRARRFDAIAAALDPSVPVDDRPAVLERMAAAIPSGEPRSVQLVGDQHFSSPAGHVVNLTYEYDYAGRWILANVAIKSRDGVDTILGLNVTPLARPLEEQHRFALGGHAVAAYLVLALAIAMPLLTGVALVACVRTPLKGRKWPWILFILAGMGSVGVDWATDAWDFHVFSIQFLSAYAVSGGPYSPWIVGFGFPVGAVLFLLWRPELKAVPAPPPAVADAPAA